MEGKKTGQISSKIKKELTECEKEKQQYLEGWQRTKADFINYRKQEEKGREQQVKKSQRFLLLEILPVAEDLERLETASKEQKTELESLRRAIAQIRMKMDQFLSKEGISKIKSRGEEFNPHLHEAVKQEKSRYPKDKIIEEVAPGYLHHGELLRPAKVKVSG